MSVEFEHYWSDRTCAAADHSIRAVQARGRAGGRRSRECTTRRHAARGGQHRDQLAPTQDETAGCGRSTEPLTRASDRAANSNQIARWAATPRVNSDHVTRCARRDAPSAYRNSPKSVDTRTNAARNVHPTGDRSSELGGPRSAAQRTSAPYAAHHSPNADRSVGWAGHRSPNSGHTDPNSGDLAGTSTSREPNSPGSRANAYREDTPAARAVANVIDDPRNAGRKESPRDRPVGKTSSATPNSARRRLALPGKPRPIL